MDFRVKTFVPEATRRLEFLTTEYGCAGPVHHDVRASLRKLHIVEQCFLRLGRGADTQVAPELLLEHADDVLLEKRFHIDEKRRQKNIGSA